MERSQRDMPETTTAGLPIERACPLCPVLLGVALGLAAVSAFGQEATTNAPAADNSQSAGSAHPAEAAPLGRDYQAFQLVNDRNIFNPNRTRRSRYNQEESEKPREPKIDVVALTGTLSYAKGTYAFFNSTANEFRKAARVGDEIAGYTLKGIEQTQVALERESQQLQLKVGQQLRRQDEGPWEVTSDAAVAGDANNPGRSSRSSSGSSRSSRREAADARTVATSETPPAAGSSSGEGPSEALKRLLEQRRKEQAQ